jgi:MarR family transcriptional regulator, organic hydroperoxide resistance regulator
MQESDVTTRLARLLPELAVALYETGPHHGEARHELSSATLTGRQMEAVIFLAHRGAVTMSEFSAGLEISRAAATELVARLTEKGLVRREADEADRRLVRVRLGGAAEALAEDALDQWRARLSSVFARFPDIDPGTLVAFLSALIDELKGRKTP